MATAARIPSLNLGIETEQTESFQSQTHCQELIQRLQSRRNLSDVVLIVGRSGKRIEAHRLILIACSDYFSDLLSEPMSDVQQREVTLSEVDEDSMEELIDYCYSGSLELDGDTIGALLVTANLLRLKQVIEGCCEFLQRHLQPSNSLDVAFFAEQLDLDSFVRSTRKFICENFEEVSNQPSFLLINAKQLSEFFASDALCTPSDEFVFEVLTKWIEYEPETRRRHFPDLLAQMKLSRLSQSFLLTKVEPLCDEMQSLKLVTNALKNHPVTSDFCQPRNRLPKPETVPEPVPEPVPKPVPELVPEPVPEPVPQLVPEPISEPEPEPVVKNLLIIRKKRYQPYLVITSYNLQAEMLTVCSTLAEAHDSCAVALIAKKLIIVGGLWNGSCLDHRFCLDTVTILNLSTMTSTKMASLQTRRMQHAVAVLNGSVYAIGGVNKSGCLDSVEKFDFMHGEWISVAAMRQGRRCLSVATLNNQLYVTGGYFTAGNYVTSLESYDPVRNVWNSLARMQVERHSHGFAAYKGYLFVIAGQRIISVDEQRYELPVERYDPRTNTWTTIPCSPSFLGETKCTSLGSELFVYNNSKIFMIGNDGSCDNLEFREIASVCSPFRYADNFLALPYTLTYNSRRMKTRLGQFVKIMN